MSAATAWPYRDEGYDQMQPGGARTGTQKDEQICTTSSLFLNLTIPLCISLHICISLSLSSFLFYHSIFSTIFQFMYFSLTLSHSYSDPRPPAAKCAQWNGTRANHTNESPKHRCRA